MPSQDAPLLSVLICTHNYGRFLPTTLRSVLAQSWPRGGYEVLVVDDGSTDDTPEVLKAFAAEVRVLPQAHGGQAKAMNAGMAAARGRVLCFLDADDVWHPDKLRRVAEAFRGHPEAGLVQHWMANTASDEIGRPLEAGAGRVMVSRPEEFLDGRVRFTGTSGLSFPRELALSLGPIPEGAFFCADEHLYTAAALAAPVVTWEGFLGRRRIHDRNWYAASLSSRRRLENMASVRRVLDEALAGRMSRLGLSFTPRAQAARRWERLREQALLLTVQGRPGEARRLIKDTLAETPPSPYRLFQKGLLLLATALPRLYIWLREGPYQRLGWLYELRRRLFPDRS